MAEPDDAPRVALPVTFRPRKARIVAYGMGLAMLTASVVLALILPDDWKLADRAGMVLFGLLLFGCTHLLARPRLDATAEGLTVVNIIRTRILDWPEIVQARMPVGEPWPTLDLAHGETLACMGIQSNDGAYARARLAELRALIHEHGEAPEPPA